MEPDEQARRRVAEEARSRAVFEARDARSESGRGLAGARAAAHRRLSAERMARLAAILSAQLPAGVRPRILDVGCGGGHDLAAWGSAGWAPGELAGIDLVPARVAAARERCPGVDVREGSGAGLPFADASFDVATAATVFSSILDAALRRQVHAEMRRVVRPGGLVVVYDFVIRNPRNPSVVAMPVDRLVEAAGRAPDGSERLGPLVYLVAAGAFLHPVAEALAVALAPRTHRLTWWRVP
jgi:SAM-dependent methyltransferase